ncbi:tetraspanin-4 [Denticeps clupeoides]|uniref:Tetraspanin n=1 Tax=Denticeps clupeoides TaxID=299321 RepID=A0AAY4CL52_9TELE|nr:tetraspanin-4-like [Denticeps clupeoides]
MSATRRCLCCVKYLMFIFNLVFWLGGCGLFGVGVWLTFKQAEFSSLPLSFPSLSAANLLLVAGGLTMVIGFLGCLGALKEQRCLLITFFVILLVLVVTEITLIVILNVFHKELDEKAQNDLKEGLKEYKTNKALQNSWDKVQIMFKCCGVTNKTDWFPVMESTSLLPQSCCLNEQRSCTRGWEESCYEKARKWLVNNNTAVLVFGICIGVVQILALVFSMLMYCQIVRAEKYLD